MKHPDKANKLIPHFLYIHPRHFLLRLKALLITDNVSKPFKEVSRMALI